jgi:hypothetical protein
VVNVSGSAGVPQFNLQAYRTTGTPGNVDNKDLVNINKFFREIDSQNQSTGERTYTLEEEWALSVTTGSYQLRLKYENYNGSSFTVVNNPEANTNGYLAVDVVNNAADYRIMKIAPNLPYGENGIKQIDFIKGLQKKFNLIIYPSKTKPNHFIVQTFNDWYKQGTIKSFNDYIDLNKKIEVIPANNLAVRELNFGDLLGKDYLAQQFDKEVNREFGKIEYVDTQNFFSQGKLDVETTFSASPLRYIQGTGVSGSAAPTPGVPIAGGMQLGNSTNSVCFSTPVTVYTIDGFFPSPGDIIYQDVYLTQPYTGYSYTVDPAYDIRTINSSTGEYLGSFAGVCFGQS